MRTDEELEADLIRLLEEKAQLEKEQAETEKMIEGIKNEMHVAELLDNILKIGKHETP